MKAHLSRSHWPLVFLALFAGSERVDAGVLPEEEPILLTAEEHAQAIEILRSQWESARTEIVSAAIKYRMSRASFIVPYVPADRLLSMIEKYDVQSHPERIYDLASELNAKSPALRPERFFPCELYLEGTRLKVDDSSGLLYALDDTTFYFYNKPNSHIDLILRGRSSIGYDHPFTIRPIPRGLTLDLVTSIRRYPEAGLLLLNFGGKTGFDTTFHLVYEATGLPCMMRIWGTNAGLERDEFFHGHTTFPGGVTFPTVSFEFGYRNGLIANFTAYLIDEAEFNSPIKPSDLAFRAPAGTDILDRRDEGQLNSTTFTQDVADVPYFVNHVLDYNSSSPPASELIPQHEQVNSSQSFLLWINGCILLVAGLFLWRYRPSEQPAEKN